MTELITAGETALFLSPPGNERLEATDRLRVQASGVESNVAVAAGRVGADAVWCTKLRDTPLGRRAVAELRGHGIDTEVVWSDEGRQGLAFHEPGRKPREAFTLSDRDGTATETLTPGDLPMGRVQSAGIAFVSGATLALSEQAAETAGAVLRAVDGAAALGLDYQPDRWESPDAARETVTDLFPSVDVLLANEEEAKTVLGKSGEPPELAHGIASEWDFETVVLTRGEFGALAWHDATIHDRDAVETDAVDVTGQHDAFTGGFLATLLAGESIDEALQYGAATAALARTIPGPLPTVQRSEVERIVEDMGGSGFGF